MREKLTIDYAIENKFTPNHCVQYYFPDYDYKLCNYILWEKTCFPLSMVTTLEQLYELYLKSKDKTEQSEVNNT